MNKRMNSLLACVALGVVLTGCYVVPIQDGWFACGANQ